MTLSGKVAVVTGSSKGIGRAIALRLAKAKADVLVCANQSVESAKGVAQEIAALGVRADVLRADLSDPTETERLVSRAIDWRGRVDVWVNNAGVDVLTGENADAEFFAKLESLWQVDVVAAMRCSRAIGEHMKSAGAGSIINIGWDQAWHGMEGDSGEMFAAIKGAVMSFTKSLAKSLAPDVRVNCVAPGWIKTEWGEDASPYWQERAIQESLRGRWGTPEDIAEAVCFLASPAADFISGQIVPVNGGFRNASQKS